MLPSKSKVTFVCEVLPETMPVKGNALRINCKQIVEEHENKILKRQAKNDKFAWCQVQVTARYGELMSISSLRCRSFDSEKDFMKGDYFALLIDEAYADLLMLVQKNLAAAAQQ